MILPLCAAFIGLLGFQSFAAANPPPKDPEAMVDQRMEEMTEALSLTETQQTSIRVILENMAEEMEALHDSAGDGNRPDREEMKALRDEYDEQIEAELTAEQQVLFKKMLEEGKQQNQNRNGGRQRSGSGSGHRGR